jgi:hypothetical protein
MLPRLSAGRAIAMALGSLAIACTAFLYGFVIHATERPPYRTLVSTYYALGRHPTLRAAVDRIVGIPPAPGNWLPAPSAPAEGSAQDEIERLQALGYVAGTDPAPAARGITVYDRERASPGLNLYTSGHAPEASLMTMDGRVLHRWRLSFEDAFPGRPSDAVGTESWRRAFLDASGNLLAIFEGQGLVKIDKDSRLIWALANGSHHDLDRNPDGEIHVLTRRAHVVPAFHPFKPILEDFVTVVGADGSERGSRSLLEAFENSPYSPLLDQARRGAGDIFHTNTLEVMDGHLAHLSPLFEAGNALVSLNSLNVIAIVDLEANRVVWSLVGLSRGQHSATILENGHLLFLGNLGNGGYSKVVEIDPLTQRIVWSFLGDHANDFVTRSCGSVQRLRNGNTLITISNRGRAIEVTPDHEIVWEFMSPHRAGDHDELVANLFEVQRIEPGFPLGWLATSRPPRESASNELDRSTR